MASSCVYVDHDSYPEFCSEKLVRARKPHICGECGDPIQPGDLHEYVTGKWDGCFSDHRTCARCLNVRHDYFESWIYGEMVEAFQETHGIDYRDGIPADLPPCRGRSS